MTAPWTTGYSHNHTIAQSFNDLSFAERSSVVAQAAKLDLYKTHKSEYVTPKQPALVNVKPAKYLTLMGRGTPGGPEFQAGVGALYGVAFTVKTTKKFSGKDYKVCHLEGLWWGNEMTGDFSQLPPESWHWMLLIRVPDFIKDSDVKAAVSQLKAKGKGDGAEKVKLETIEEGQCVQMLHVGSYASEVESIRRMMEFASQQGLACRGRHHEIYLSDPRRVPAERLRTILRYSVGRAA
jgi:hypothetical protein